MGRPLTLAASAIAAGFLAFAPTAYIGVSQLGVIAGVGMFVALALNLTLLPALIALLAAAGPPEPRPPPRRSAGSTPILGHRRWVLGIGVGAAAVCAALLPLLHFDFNPIHLRSPKSRVGRRPCFDLMRDPDRRPNTLEVVRPNLAAAAGAGARLASAARGRQRAHAGRASCPPTSRQAGARSATPRHLLDLTLNPIDVAPPPTRRRGRAEPGRHRRGPAPGRRPAPTRRPRDARRLADALDTAGARPAGACAPGRGRC